MANNFTHTRLPIVCLIFALLLNVDYVTAQEETDITAQTDSTRETTLWYLSNGNMYSTSSASRIGLLSL